MRSMPIINDQNSQLVTETGCRIWMKSCSHQGYGRVRVKGKLKGAHRVAYEEYTGREIQNGLHVLHKCDTPSCVNPLHLFLGTNNDNVADKMRKGRHISPGVKGDKHWNSRLSASDVGRIRELRADGEPLKSISVLFGVSDRQISKICLNQRWKGECTACQ